MTNVLILYGGFIFKSGGAYGHATSLSQALLSLGYNSVVLSLDSIPRPFRYIPHLVFFLTYIICPSFSFSLKGAVISLLFRIYLYLSRIPYDLLIFEDLYLAWSLNKPYLVIVHALWSDNLESYSLTPRDIATLKYLESDLLSQHSPKCVTVSSEYSQFLTREHLLGYGLPSLPVIPLGIDVDFVSSFANPKNQSRNPYSIVFTGLFCERKNLLFLLDVYRCLRLNSSRFELTLIGDGPLLPDLISFSNRYSLPLNLPGRLSGGDLYSHISSHSIFLTTSTKESFSFSLLEAKILGLTTFAHSSLEVPSEFIDFPVSSWLLHDWVDSICSHHKTQISSSLEISSYSSRQMAISTIAMANNIKI